MRVVCISENAGFDAIPCDLLEGVTKGNVYTVIEECNGYGKFWWWPFSEPCYALAGFDDNSCYPKKCFVEINENTLDELVLVNEKQLVNQ